MRELSGLWTGGADPAVWHPALQGAGKGVLGLGMGRHGGPGWGLGSRVLGEHVWSRPAISRNWPALEGICPSAGRPAAGSSVGPPAQWQLRMDRLERAPRSGGERPGPAARVSLPPVSPTALPD